MDLRPTRPRFEPLARFVVLALLGAVAIGCDSDTESAGTEDARPSVVTDGAVTDGGTNQPACGDCTIDTRRCAGDSAYEACLLAPDGCARWSTAVDCADGTACSDGRCCTDSCAEGAGECTPSGIRRCERVDGCLTWTSPSACPDGTACVDGACSDACANPCERGAVRCIDASSYEVCADFGGGCDRFSEPVACNAGETCRDGQCVGCDTCEQGAATCLDETTRVTCERDEAGCLQPSTAPCPDRCVDGTCANACDQCAEGQSRCRDGTNEVCRRADGCTDWVADGPCQGPGCTDACAEPGQRVCTPDGATFSCQRGADGCLERVRIGGCPPGARECIAAGGWRECVQGPDGCHAWDVRACEGGVDCFRAPGVCYGGCGDVCEPGTRECGDAGTYRECRIGLDGCPRWDAFPCLGAVDCQAGPAACFGECFDLCQVGSRDCAGVDQFRVCVRGEDGCAIWEERPCAEDGASCFQAPDACFGACEHACEPGETRCGAGATWQTCEADFDGCRQWEDRQCAFGVDSCEAAPIACQGACEDFCSVGFTRCLAEDRYETCVAGAGGCPEWQEAMCRAGRSCFAQRDACTGACEDECELDARVCESPDRFARCIQDFNGCTEWQSLGCFQPGSCNDTPGACFGDCFNACDDGDVQCAGNDTWRDCTIGPDGCRTFGDPQPCQGGANCFVNRQACAGR